MKQEKPSLRVYVLEGELQEGDIKATLQDWSDVFAPSLAQHGFIKKILFDPKTKKLEKKNQKIVPPIIPEKKELKGEDLIEVGNLSDEDVDFLLNHKSIGDILRDALKNKDFPPEENEPDNRKPIDQLRSVLPENDFPKDNLVNFPARKTAPKKIPAPDGKKGDLLRYIPHTSHMGR